MEDVVNARLAGNETTDAWQSYCSTLSAEYLGRSRAGNRILIVAHGIGPMTELDNIMAAYKHEFKARRDLDRESPQPTISQQQFRDLESGKYGDVHVVDFDAWCKSHGQGQSPRFNLELTFQQALQDPLMLARYGHKAVEYLQHIHNQSRKLHERFSDVPFIADMSTFNLYVDYSEYPSDTTDAFAKLLFTGKLEERYHRIENEDYRYYNAEVSEAHWHYSAYLLGIQATSEPELKEIYYPTHLERLFEKYWQTLLEMNPVSNGKAPFFCGLTKIGEQWFTQYPKFGSCREHIGHPEFLISRIQPMKNAGESFVAYEWDMAQIERIAPEGANAYQQTGHTEGGELRGKGVRPHFHFYRVDIDTSHRLPEMSDLENDYDTLLKLFQMHYSQRKPRKRVVHCHWEHE